MVNSKSMEISNTEDSVDVIVVLMANIDKYKLSSIKEGIAAIQRKLENDIFIDRPNSPYDCTGQAFTSHLDLLNKDIAYDIEGYYLRYTYIHKINFDV